MQLLQWADENNQGFWVVPETLISTCGDIVVTIDKILFFERRLSTRHCSS